MKRIHLTAALILLIPSLSSASVDFYISSPAPGLIRIGYHATAGEAVRGISLLVELTNGATAVYTDIVSIHPAFNAFIEYAAAYPTDYELGDGHPFAYPYQPGPLEVPSSFFSLVMGSLDPTGGQAPAPAIVDDLITFRVQDGGAGFTSVLMEEDISIQGDMIRGGVIVDDVEPVTVTFNFMQPYIVMIAAAALPIQELTVNDGRPCYADRIVPIQWTTTLEDYAKLQYSDDDGSHWVDIDQGVYWAGPVYWKIPDGIDSENCSVRAVSLDGASLYGITNDTFNIRPCSVQLDLTGDCFVDFRDLAIFAGEWLMGQDYES